jgi:hypothetical protein
LFPNVPLKQAGCEFFHSDAAGSPSQVGPLWA